jgi:hypothetical protein
MFDIPNHCLAASGQDFVRKPSILDRASKNKPPNTERDGRNGAGSGVLSQPGLSFDCHNQIPQVSLKD